MEGILNSIWGYVIPIGGGITIGAVIVAIGTIIIKSAVSKILSKINVEKTEEKAVNKGIEKVKEISFKQSIQPLAESELKKITENANSYIKEELDRVHNDYIKIILILEKFSAYFDNSIAITEEKKEELKKALVDAKEDLEIVETEIKVVEEQKVEPKVEKSKKIDIVR